jgi:hypothetical protein
MLHNVGLSALIHCGCSLRGPTAVRAGSGIVGHTRGTPRSQPTGMSPEGACTAPMSSALLNAVSCRTQLPWSMIVLLLPVLTPLAAWQVLVHRAPEQQQTQTGLRRPSSAAPARTAGHDRLAANCVGAAQRDILHIEQLPVIAVMN